MTRLSTSLRLCVARTTLLSLLLACTVRSHAQQDPQTSMYWAVPTLYNPAAAGLDSTLHIAAFNRMQWVGVSNAPQTFFVEADMPLRLFGQQHGVGVEGMNDRAGLFTTMQFGLQYAYHTRLWGGRLAVGIQGGVVNQTFAGGDIYIPDGDAWEAGDDALPSGDVSAMAFDGAAGVYYERRLWYAGIGVQHLSESTLELDEYAYTTTARTYYFHVGGNIPLRHTLFIVQPSLLVKSTIQTTQVDYTLRATYDQRFWGGVTYRHGDAVVLMVGADIGNVRVGYAYDIGVSPLARVSHGSHELLAAYTLQLDFGRRRGRPSKSIRIL